MKKYIGVDIGGTSVKAGLVSEDGSILRKSSIPTLPARRYTEVINDIAKLIAELARGEEIEGVGIGCPGSIDSVGGVVNFAGNLNWKNVPLAADLNKLTGFATKLCNDASAAALGEVRFGAGKKYTDAVMITLGTGVGGGIITDGKLFDGYRGLGGEIGHMVIKAGGEPCSCGRRGCFEAYASATALIRDTVTAMKCNKNSIMWEYVGGDLNKVDGKTSFECAKKGDRAAKSVVKRYIEYLAEGVVNIINIFRSQAIILGGGICAQGKYLTEPLIECVNEKRFGGEDSFVTEITVASLGNEAGILGAASLFINK